MKNNLSPFLINSKKLEYKISNITKIVKGAIVGKKNDSIIKQLLIDSRQLTTPESTAFFAIRGDRHDGHHFIKPLYDRGVRFFVVDKNIAESTQLKDACFIKVKNVLAALQTICSYHRKRFDIPVIGITGSNGKTIVKEWLFQLMCEDKNIVRSPKSYNSQVGVPLSVWQMDIGYELAIFEAGISEIGEMQKLENVIQPTIGVITNIGPAHSENFRSEKQKTLEKLKLFKGCRVLVYCKDKSQINSSIPKSKKLTQFNWSQKNKNASLFIEKINVSKTETIIKAVHNKNNISITIPFADEASIENAIHCWCTMLHLGYENKIIALRMRTLSPVAMRLEMKEGINNCLVINDSYNSDLGSLSIALDFLNQQKQHISKTIILSDILQSGKDEKELYKEVAKLLASKGVHRLIGIGECISRQANLFSVNKHFFNSTAEFIKHFNNIRFNNEAVLIKGARLFGFEKISQLLQHKAHETVMEIDLNAVVHNLNYYRSKLKKGTKLMAMVKASSYGSGSFEIANVLQFHNIDYLAVAYADEGVELRKAGITLPIMVMNPEEQGYETMLEHNLEPEIFSLRALKLFLETAKQHSLSDKQIAIHIKLDTGMHRLGFESSEIDELIQRIKKEKNSVIRSMFSHLSGADDSGFNDFTHQQIEKFEMMSNKISKKFNYKIDRHILNSAGISRFPNAQYDMVRLGIGLYGIGVDENEQKQLQFVNSLKSTISQIRNVYAGESVGYSRAYIANKNMMVATVPIGYADGLSRKLGNRKGKLFVNGKAAPIVGNICMDMCMIDITGINAKEGDSVEIFGEHHSIIDFANDMETIAYEVLTSVSRRVKRVYYHE